MYDIIGDVHGCYDELILLLRQLGYEEKNGLYRHPNRRQFVFVGDLTDRGPQSIKVIDFVSKHVQQKLALYVPGNHCDKLYRWFLGRNVQIQHGLETTVAEFERLTPAEQTRTRQAFMSLVEQSPLYLMLDKGQLIVSHAGLREDLIGRKDKRVKRFCLYGDITGEKDEHGFPIRKDWATHYRGKEWIVYGHTPVRKPRFLGRTVNIDTGCVFGGQLTGLRYPEWTWESVPSSLPYVAEKFRHVH